MHILVRIHHEKSQWHPVEVTTLENLPQLLEPGWSTLELFPESGHGWTWTEGEPHPVLSRHALPLTVRLAWWGMRNPGWRWRYQLACWIFLIAALAAPALGLRFHPSWYILPGSLNVFAWWWWESDKGRIQPLDPRVTPVTT
jgi:hypothetical protein